MMLVVFTVFLGMELKSAVGTSTFIMTFTALIASFSHIMIHPAIILERWNVSLLCIVVATIASLLSAQFANRVNNKTVGLVTSVILTLLGASMLILHYYSIISKISIIVDVLHCLGMFVIYIIPCVIVLLGIKFFIQVPQFIFRKLLHIVAFSCTSFLIIVAKSWQAATISSCLIAILIYSILSIFEENTWYSNLFVQKKTGEVKRSLLMLFFMIATITVVSWGVFNKPYLAVIAILMWGTGDGTAALIGIPYGKHKITLPYTNGNKSWEGTITMAIISFLSGIVCFIFFYHYPIINIWFMTVIGAIVGSIMELFHLVSMTQ